MRTIFKEGAMRFSGEYKNIYLVSAILAFFVAFMAISTYVVVKDVTSGRSCVRTCDGAK
jgi:hypothetical protein